MATTSGFAGPDMELTDFTQAISSGAFDGFFEDIERALDQRRQARRDAVLSQVHEVFGVDADVIVRGNPNPFIKKSNQNADGDSPEAEAPDDAPDDQAEQSDIENNMNETERRMIEEGNSGELPIESRGAIIGGLSSSDIGE